MHKNSINAESKDTFIDVALRKGSKPNKLLFHDLKCLGST